MLERVNGEVDFRPPPDLEPRFRPEPRRRGRWRRSPALPVAVKRSVPACKKPHLLAWLPPSPHCSGQPRFSLPPMTKRRSHQRRASLLRQQRQLHRFKAQRASSGSALPFPATWISDQICSASPRTTSRKNPPAQHS